MDYLPLSGYSLSICTLVHADTDWRDVYSRPTGLWQVMRSPREKYVIILTSRSLKERKTSPIWPHGSFGTSHARAYTRMRSQTQKKRKKHISQTRMQQKESCLWHQRTQTAVHRLPVTVQEYRKNEHYKKTTTQSSASEKKRLSRLVCSATNYAAKYKSPWAICMTTTASNCLC